jgi:two-component system, NtrC family, sensor kinase
MTTSLLLPARAGRVRGVGVSQDSADAAVLPRKEGSEREAPAPRFCYIRNLAGQLLPRTRMKSSVFRHLQLVTFAFLALIVAALVASAVLTALEARHLAAAHAELSRRGEFERIHLVVSRRLTTLAEGEPASPRGRPLVMGAIDRMIELSSDPDTPARLEALRVRLQQRTPAGTELAESLTLISQVGASEQQRETAFLAHLQRQNSAQLRLEIAAPLALVAFGLLVIPFARQRVLKPLDAFGHQLERLAAGQFTPTPVNDAVDPFLLPLHRQFNALAERLQELELAHQQRAASLEGEVRAATHQLLEQQRSLARAERLAATGELAASLAHELRNPLAGLQMTLSNLRAELSEPDLRERAELMIEEVGRLTRLLNGLLDAARHAPEAARPVQLAELIADTLALTRYQLPSDVTLDNRVDPALTVRLPPDRLRQVVLNLALNAASALSGRRGTIAVDASVVDHTLRLTISDDGPGFPRELLENGIRPFYSTRERGTGLGLAMVRRFVRDLGGTIELTNRDPQGAQVTLVVPAEAEHA